MKIYIRRAGSPFNRAAKPHPRAVEDNNRWSITFTSLEDFSDFLPSLGDYGLEMWVGSNGGIYTTICEEREIYG